MGTVRLAAAEIGEVSTVERMRAQGIVSFSEAPGESSAGRQKLLRRGLVSSRSVGSLWH